VEGKIVLDANDYYPERDRHIAKLDRGDVTTRELLARHLPKSKIVKDFNAIQAAEIESDGWPAGGPDRRAPPIAGDDTDATMLVADLLELFGCDVVDAGPLVEGRRFQKDTPAYCVRLNREKLINALALT
jgi:8-hydroxy-5-deazaflavin:NADPH oxidoreductase